MYNTYKIMNFKKGFLVPLLVTTMICSGCSETKVTNDKTTENQNATATIENASTTLPTIDNNKWNYNEEDGVYWQVQIPYCSNPADSKYETLGIFIPAAYMNATDNGDGTYTCELNQEAVVGNYTATNAPIVIPVETPGYSAMAAPTNYISSVSGYTNAGFIYVNAGCRGRDVGAPAGVTDLKAAVRYIRYNKGTIPGSMDRIFTFGMSGGGAQSALMGATGDSELYTPYWEAIGAVENVSDAVAGSMCWCPITNLDYANEAYEWNLGSTRSDLDEDTQTLSDNLATAFAEYINDIGLKDSEGNILTLAESEKGIYQAGSYYDYTKKVIEQSLNHFLSDTTFPYTTGGTNDFGGRGGMGNREFKDLDDIGDGELPDKMPGNGEKLTGKRKKEDFKDIDVDDKGDFQKDTDNTGGYTDENGAHFDSIMADLLKGSDYEEAFTEDLAKTDCQGNTVDTRLNMYYPMYYLSDYYDGYQTSSVAKYWRIRTGINQGDTALSTEINLSLALQNYDNTSVDFETVST